MFRSGFAHLAATIAVAAFALGGLPWARASTSVPLSFPSGLAVDDEGRLHVANRLGNSVAVYSPGLHQVGAIAAGLNGPEGLAVDRSGNTYVANVNGYNITEYDPSGAPLASFSVSVAPRGVAVDGLGQVYVADYSPYVGVYDMAEGKITVIRSVFGGDNQIASVAAERGTVSFAEIFKGVTRPSTIPPATIVSFTAIRQILENVGAGFLSGIGPGMPSSFEKTPLSVPVGLAIDAAHDAWIADASGDQVQFLPAGGAARVLIQLSYRPGGVAVDAARKRLFVSDPDHNRVYVYNAFTGAPKSVIE